MGQSNWSSSATGTTSAIVTVNHSQLYFADTSATSAPTTTRSAALPLARNITSINWKKLQASPNNTGVSPFIFTNGNGGPSSATLRQFASMPLVAATIAAMNYSLYYGQYSESSQVYQMAASIYVWRPSTDAVVGYIYDSAAGIGNPTSGSNSATAGRIATVTGNSVVVQDGDILCFEWWAVTTNASASYLHQQYNGPNQITEGCDTGANAAAKIAFASPIGFQS